MGHHLWCLVESHWKTTSPLIFQGAKLLSYLYELCLRNMNSNVINSLLYLLKVSCTPYLR